MNYKEILEGLEQIHCEAQEIESEIKAHQLDNEGFSKHNYYEGHLKFMFNELFTKIETVREPLFDLVHSGKIDK